MLDRKTRSSTGSTNSDLCCLGVSVPLSAALVLDAQVARLDVKKSNNDNNFAVARLTYNLSKRTALYTSFGYMNNRGTAAIALDSGGSVGVGKN